MNNIGLNVKDDADEAAERYEYVRGKYSWYIAANFYKNQELLDYAIPKYIELIQFLGPEKVFVSVFEIP